MNLNLMRGQWQQFYGCFLEFLGARRANSRLWIKGRHIRLGGMLLICQQRAGLVLVSSKIRERP